MPPKDRSLLRRVAMALVVVGCGGRMGGSTNDSSAGTGAGNSDTSTSTGEQGGAGTAGTLTPGSPDASGGSVVGTAGSVVDLTTSEAQALYDMACSGARIEVDGLPHFVHFLVDASDSMNAAVTGSAATQWPSTLQSLLETFDTIQFVDPYHYVQPGLRLLPLHSLNASATAPCIASLPEVPLAATTGDVHAQFALITQILNETVPAGKTPLMDAYQAAATELAARPLAMAAASIVLVTDGNGSLGTGCSSACTPTSAAGGAPAQATACEVRKLASTVDAEVADHQPLLDAIDTLYTTVGIRTFVVGTEGSEANREWLSTAAVLGGTAKAAHCGTTSPNGSCHIDLPGGDNLASVLSSHFTSSLFPDAHCTSGFVLSGDEALNVVLVQSPDGIQWVTQDTLNTPTCREGFRADANGVIKFCMDTCTRLKQTAISSIEVLHVCTTS